MKVVFLGTVGYHPTEQQQTLCLLLPECGVMLDAGTGVFRAGEFLQTPELDIFITHAHADHIIGLTYFVDVQQVHPLRRITLHGAADKLAAVETHLYAEALFPSRPPFDFKPLPDGKDVPLPNGGRLTHFPLPHRGGSTGFRLDWPSHSMALVTDTTADVNAPYVDIIRGVDLLVHECYFPDSRIDDARRTGHSWTTAMANVARKADVRQLVVVHQDPLASPEDPIGLATARAIFPNTILSKDRMEIAF